MQKLALQSPLQRVARWTATGVLTLAALAAAYAGAHGGSVRVPQGSEYVVSHGGTTKRFGPGQAAPLTDCVEIHCPKHMIAAATKRGKELHCWNCGD